MCFLSLIFVGNFVGRLSFIKEDMCFRFLAYKMVLVFGVMVGLQLIYHELSVGTTYGKCSVKELLEKEFSDESTMELAKLLHSQVYSHIIKCSQSMRTT